VEKEDTRPGTFANNDLVPIDRNGCDHGAFSEGLKKSLYNYMHGICFDFPVQQWFDFQIPRTTIAPDFIRSIISQNIAYQPGPHARIIWTGAIPQTKFYVRQKKGKSIPSARIIIQTTQQEVVIQTDEQTGKWLADIFPILIPGKHDPLTFQKLEELYIQGNKGNFKAFWEGPIFKSLRKTELFLIV
jgi:hypothetical protein